MEIDYKLNDKIHLLALRMIVEDTMHVDLEEFNLSPIERHRVDYLYNKPEEEVTTEDIVDLFVEIYVLRAMEKIIKGE